MYGISDVGRLLYRWAGRCSLSWWGRAVYGAYCKSLLYRDREVVYPFGWYIKMPEDVPILTIQSFKLIVPIFAVMISISTFNVFLDAQFGVHFPQLIEELFRPLVLASDSLAAVLISILICQLLWFMGIHGALIITGIMNPFWMSNLLENQTALEAGGQVLPHIYLPAFWDFFVLLAGWVQRSLLYI